MRKYIKLAVSMISKSVIRILMNVKVKGNTENTLACKRISMDLW